MLYQPRKTEGRLLTWWFGGFLTALEGRRLLGPCLDGTREPRAEGMHKALGACSTVSSPDTKPGLCLTFQLKKV